MDTKREGRRNREWHETDRTGQPIALWLHGLAALGDERWEDAVDMLRRFLDLSTHDKNRILAYMNLSTCYVALERYDCALEALDQAEQYGAQTPEMVHGRATTYACAGRIQEAIATFKSFRSRWPRQARQLAVKEDIRELRRIKRGVLTPGDYLLDHLKQKLSHDIDMGDFHLVERKGRRMIAANPDRPEGHFALGLACVEQARYEEALAAFLAAHAREPDYVPTLYNIGRTYLLRGDPEQAIPWLEQILARDPDHVPVLHQLGVACERLGRRDAALAWWQRALEIDPDYDLVRESLHKIGEGPAPSAPPLPPETRELKRVTRLVKSRMRHPHVCRNGGVSLTYDEIGFVLEDAENPLNGTAYSAPYNLGEIPEHEKGHVLDMIGMVKMLLGLVDFGDTRYVSVLVYYSDRPMFGYEARFSRNERIALNTMGQFIVTEVPRFFKLRIDSDLGTPYGNPMQGVLMYLDQPEKPGVFISTMPDTSV